VKGHNPIVPQARTLEKLCAFITAPEGSTQPLEERMGHLPSFFRFHYAFQESSGKQGAY
jgi:hypothetical protein